MATSNIYDMADTWNAGGTTFTAIKMDVTDTASAADSKLLDLQVASSSKFAIDKNGVAIFGGDTQLQRDAAHTIGIHNSTNAQLLHVYNSRTDASNYERGCFEWVSNTLKIGSAAAGTGAGRAVDFQYGGTRIARLNSTTTFKLYAHFRVNGNGVYDIGESGFAFRDIYLNGDVFNNGLPTTDPAVAGQWWSDSGTVKVSAG